MLPLTGKRKEKIAMYWHGRLMCTLKIGRISGQRVQLYFDAPRDFRIVREHNDDDDQA